MLYARTGQRRSGAFGYRSLDQNKRESAREGPDPDQKGYNRRQSTAHVYPPGYTSTRYVYPGAAALMAAGTMERAASGR